MRSPIAACFIAFIATPALAGSIDTVLETANPSSVTEIRCGDCPALKPKEKADTYHVDALKPGTQKVEIRDIDGEKMIYRTEAWMGGSPVVFVSKFPADEVDTAAADEKPAAIDTAATTGALDAATADSVKTAEMGGSRQFDPSGFELRLN